MDHWGAYALLGLLAGVISGGLGVGSGLVLIPALVLLFAVPQKSAQGIALTVMVPMAFVGAIRYIANPDIKVDARITCIVATGAVVGALVGSHLASVLPGRVLKKAFAAFLLLVAARILWPSGRHAPPGKGQDVDTGQTTAAEVPLAQVTESATVPDEDPL